MKKCGACGADLPDGYRFCPFCGAKADGVAGQGAEQSVCYGAPATGNGLYPQIAPPQQKPMNGIGLAGMIVGIIAAVFCWMPVLGLASGIVGIVLSVKGLRRNAQCSMGGFAVAGLVLSIIGTAIGGIYTLSMLALIVQISAV